jgi:hypothetical protein
MMTHLVRVWVASKALHAPARWKLLFDLCFAHTNEINSDSGSYAIEHGRPGSLTGSGGICHYLLMRSLVGPGESSGTYWVRWVLQLTS